MNYRKLEILSSGDIQLKRYHTNGSITRYSIWDSDLIFSLNVYHLKFLLIECHKRGWMLLEDAE